MYGHEKSLINAKSEMGLVYLSCQKQPAKISAKPTKLN
ncbi:hypothetical protein imdm_413 [gamma proteobacterium IMCC2047]|nr:hypothetical protein imdm_413 [gamma proteobacterium IMCC2047]